MVERGKSTTTEGQLGRLEKRQYMQIQNLNRAPSSPTGKAVAAGQIPFASFTTPRDCTVLEWEKGNEQRREAPVLAWSSGR
jgi:hypothetical protein